MKIFTVESLKTPLCRQLILFLFSLTNNLFVALFCWFLAFGVIIAVYAVGQKHYRQIRLGDSIEEGCEVSLHPNQRETQPEEQQSQQGVHRESNAYRSMRDHIHPPRVSAPSCIIPPVEDVAVRPYLVPLLPTFHGMENENPYMHIRDFEEICTTFKEGAFNMDLIKLKAFPLTLKDKANIWLNSQRPRTIRNWAELQAEFLKKFFSAHKTNNLKRKIYTFAAHDSERFYQCSER